MLGGGGGGVGQFQWSLSYNFVLQKGCVLPFSK